VDYAYDYPDHDPPDTGGSVATCERLVEEGKQWKTNRGEDMRGEPYAIDQDD
jgi:hypothetical protein